MPRGPFGQAHYRVPTAGNGSERSARLKCAHLRTSSYTATRAVAGCRVVNKTARYRRGRYDESTAYMIREGGERRAKGGGFVKEDHLGHFIRQPALPTPPATEATSAFP